MSEPLPSNSSDETRRSLEGQWQFEDGVCFVKFDAKGGGHIASLEWSDKKQKFEIEEQNFSITTISGDWYLSGQFSAKDEDSYYSLAKCVMAEGSLVIWGASTSAFTDLIKAKKLEGSVDEGKHSSEVALSSSPKDIMTLLKTSKRKDLFDFEEPTVLRRLAK